MYPSAGEFQVSHAIVIGRRDTSTDPGGTQYALRHTFSYTLSSARISSIPITPLTPSHTPSLPHIPLYTCLSQINRASLHNGKLSEEGLPGHDRAATVMADMIKECLAAGAGECHLILSHNDTPSDTPSHNDIPSDTSSHNDTSSELTFPLPLSPLPPQSPLSCPAAVAVGCHADAGVFRGSFEDLEVTHPLNISPLNIHPLNTFPRYTPFSIHPS